MNISLETRQKIAELAQIELANRSLKDFLIYESDGRWQSARHLDVLTGTLEKVSRGELRRVIVTLPPRHGKCMVQGSPVIMADGSIKALEDIHPSDMVISIDEWYNVTRKKVTNTFNNGVRPVLKITLQSGRYIICTENHPLLTVLGWKEAETLKVGDSIAGIKKSPIPDGEPLPYAFSSLMGYITGDGSYNQSEPIITTADPEVVKHLEMIADYHGWVLRRDGKYGFHIRKPSRKGWGNGQSARERLKEYLTPAKSVDKRVPECIFKANKQDLVEFMAAYFNCDGTVNDHREGVAEYYSTSEGLLRDVQFLLTRIGVYSTLRVKNGRYKSERHVSWRLTISGQDLITFANEVPVIGQKGEKLKKVAEQCKDKRHFPEYESIPNEWKQLCIKGAGWHRNHTGIRVDKNYKRGTARHLVKTIAEAENNDELRKLCSDDVIWERITNIEYFGEKPTYDIEVEHTHNFLVMGVFVHNSEVVSKKFPAWHIGKHPDDEIILGAYALDLSRGFSRIARDTLIQNKHVFDVEIDKNNQSSESWSIAGHRGGVTAAGVGGPITGKGARIALIDDPVKNAEEANSEVMREKVWEWYQSTLYTRLTPDGRIVLVMTRWHEDDLAGRLLKKEREDIENGVSIDERWTVINFPAFAEDDDYLGRKAGDPLWPEYGFDTKKLQQIKSDVGSYVFSALYQQRPSAAYGTIFKRQHFRYFREENIGNAIYFHVDEKKYLKRDCWSFQTVDTANSEKTINDYFVVSTWYVTPQNDLLLYDVFRTHIEGPDQKPLMKEQLYRYRPRFQAIEDKTFGTNLIQECKREGMTIKAVKVDKDKVTRSLVISARYEVGKVYHRENAPWLTDYEDELLSFPRGKHDDQVDTASMAGEVVHGIAADTDPWNALPDGNGEKHDFDSDEEEQIQEGFW